MSAESADTTFANDSVVASDAAAQSPDAAAAAEADALSAGREDVEPTIFSVVVHTPHNSTIRLNHVNSADTVMSMKQLLSEVPEVCFYTCFTLTIRNETGDDTPLNDYVELEEYPEVREGAEITMRIQKYTVREGRLHIRRLRSILKSPPEHTSACHHRDRSPVGLPATPPPPPLHIAVVVCIKFTSFP
jgi:hypothetical protein